MNTYLETISKNIKNKTAKKAVIAELEAHIEEKKEYYIEIGYSEEEAEAKAVEEMGEADEVAASFNGLYTSKWYKNPINIIALLLYALILVFSLTAVYDYGDILNSREHSIVRDINSTLILGIFTFILIIAYKRKNKLLAFSVPGFIVLLFILGSVSNLILSNYLNLDMPVLITSMLLNIRHWYMLFTPFLYLIVTIFTKGPIGYINSVLSNEIFDVNKRYLFTGLSVFIFIILFSISVLIIFNIIRSERLKSLKSVSRLIKYSLKAVSLFVSVNMAVVLCSGAFVYISIPRDEIENTRLRMLNCVINAKGVNTSKNTVLKDMKDLDLTPERIDEGEYVSYNYNYYNSKISYLDSVYEISDFSEIVLAYNIDFYEFPSIISEADLMIDYASIDKYNIGYCKLKDFIEEDIFSKAYSVANQGDIITLHYITNARTTVQLTFVNGVLAEKYNFDKDNRLIEEPAPTEETLPPTTLPVVFN